MIVRRVADIEGTERDVRTDQWRSVRLLLAADGMGFSMSETTVPQGVEMEIEYRHHLEACFCVEGEAEVTDLSSGRRHAVVRGTAYALDRHDRHLFRALSDVRLVCVFNPALTGRETHDSRGGFPPPDARAPRS